MKNVTKLVVALLVVASLMVSTIAFAACDSKDADEALENKSAYQTWLDAGNTGSEEDFLNSLKGETGKSAYDIWLEAGNTGTEEDFLNWLKGNNAHEHTNLSEVVGYVDAPSVGKSGLGIAYCLDCKELVVVELDALDGRLVIGENRVVDYCLYEAGTLYTFEVKLAGEYKFEVGGTNNASVTIEYQNENGSSETVTFTDSATISVYERSVAKVYVSWTDKTDITTEGYILNVSLVSGEGGTLKFGENSLTDDGSNPAGTSYIFSTKAEGTYKFEVVGNPNASVVVEYTNVEGALVSEALNDSLTISIPERSMVMVTVLWNDVNNGEETFVLNIDFGAEEGGKLEFGENSLTDAGSNPAGTSYTFNAKIEGTYKLEVVGNPDASIVIEYIDAEGALVTEVLNGSLTISVPERTTVTVNVLWNDVNDAEETFVLNIDFGATEGGKLGFGENSLTDAGLNPAGTSYIFSTKAEGTYKFEVVGNPNASIVVEYIDAEGALVTEVLNGSLTISIPERTTVTVNVLWNDVNDAEETFTLNVDFAANVGGELIFGENSLTDNGSNPAGTSYIFSTKTEGTYKFEVVGNPNASIVVEYIDAEGALVSVVLNGSVTLNIPARTTVTVNVLWKDVNDGEETFVLNIDFGATEGGNLIVGENSLTDNGSNPAGTSYTFYTKGEGAYKFEIFGKANASIVIEYVDEFGALTSVKLNGTDTINLPAHATVTVNVRWNDVNYEEATFILSIGAGAEQGTTLVVGDNNVTDAGTDFWNGTKYTFVAETEGKYTFTISDITKADIGVDYNYSTEWLYNSSIELDLAAGDEVVVEVIWKELNNNGETITITVSK